MDQVKHWLTSKTAISAAIVVLINILTILHVHLPVNLVPADIADQVVQVTTAVLGVIAFYGRLTATTKLTG